MDEFGFGTPSQPLWDTSTEYNPYDYVPHQTTPEPVFYILPPPPSPLPSLEELFLAIYPRNLFTSYEFLPGTGSIAPAA